MIFFEDILVFAMFSRSQFLEGLASWPLSVGSLCEGYESEGHALPYKAALRDEVAPSPVLMLHILLSACSVTGTLDPFHQHRVLSIFLRFLALSVQLTCSRPPSMPGILTELLHQPPAIHPALGALKVSLYVCFPPLLFCSRSSTPGSPLPVLLSSYPSLFWFCPICSASFSYVAVVLELLFSLPVNPGTAQILPSLVVLVEWVCLSSLQAVHLQGGILVIVYASVSMLLVLFCDKVTDNYEHHDLTTEIFSLPILEGKSLNSEHWTGPHCFQGLWGASVLASSSSQGHQHVLTVTASL